MLMPDMKREGAVSSGSRPFISEQIRGEKVMLRKRLKKGGILAAVLAAAVMIITGCGSDDVRFGTAAEGGVYYLFSENFSSILQESGVHISTRDTAGSAANIRLLSQGYIDLGLAQSDLVNEMYFGQDYGLDDNYRGYSAIAALYPEYIQIVVRQDSDIQTIDDLDGCTISVGQDESGTERDAVQILSAYGLDEDQVNEVNYNYSDAMDALLDGEIDLMFVTAGIPSDILSQNTDSIRFISLEDKRRDRVISTFDGFEKATIPAGTYSGQDYDVDTLSVSAVLLAADDLSSDTVYQVTAALFDNRDELEKELGIELMDGEQAVANLSFPLHPGASAWYLDQGINISENVNRKGDSSDADH